MPINAHFVRWFLYYALKEIELSIIIVLYGGYLLKLCLSLPATNSYLVTAIS